MMSIAAGIAAIIIVLIVIVAVANFFMWLLEDQVGGKLVEAVGVIVFIAGIANAAAAAVIVGIVLFLAGIGFRSHAKETQRKESAESFARWRLRRLDEILDECWNQETLKFNWDRWWEDGDDLFYNDETETEREMKKRAGEEFRRMGRDQVYLLNLYLKWLKEEHLREKGIRQLKARESMIHSMGSLFTMYSDQDAKAYCELALRYRTDLYEYIIFARKQLTRQILQDMIDRGNAICK